MPSGGFAGTTRIIAVVALSLSAFTLAHSQTNRLLMTEEYVPRYFTKEHGLPDNQVQAILQTRDGYLWIATRAGLARFNGQKFTVFNRPNTPELANDDCRTLIEDTNGKLVVRASYDWYYHTGLQSPAFEKMTDVRAGTVWTLCSSRVGWLWAAKVNSLSRVQEGRIIESYTSNAWGGDYPHVLAEDRNGMLWIGLGGGVLRFDLQTKQFDRLSPGPEFRILPVHALSPNANGECWMLFSEKNEPRSGLTKGWLASLQGTNWVRTPRFEQPDFGCDPRSFFLVEDQSGALWLPATANSLHRFMNGEVQLISMPLLGQDDFVLCVYPDREGNLWIGTESSGLQCWQPRKVSTYTTRDGLPNDNIWTITEASDGSVWVGTDGGVSQIKNGRIVSFTQTNGLSRNEVRSVVETTNGTIWVGTLNGLDSIRNGQISHVRLPGEWFETKIRALIPARDGALWVGTVGGLTRLHNGQQSKFTTADGLGAQEVRALLEDRSGILWVGTLGGGLSCLREGKFTTLTTTNGLSNNNVWALHEDSGGDLWIGTERGLNRLKNGQLTVFTTSAGLPADGVNAILEDDFGRLWVSHDHGIYWMRLQDLNDVAAGRAKSVRCVAYDESDGLLSLETNGQKSNPAGCKSRHGRLWFPTTKGVAVIDPSKVTLDDAPPLATIELVRANGTALFDNSPEAGSKAAALRKTNGSAASAKSVRPDSQPSTLIHQLPPGSARVLEFRYTANTFVAPEKARFKYRMLGLSDHWGDTGTRREAFFADLRPGDYEFEVIAANHRGVWQEQGAAFAFRIAPFIYQTWWFYVVCGGAMTGLVAVVVAWRLRELRRIHRLEQQAAITEERTRIAKDLHDGLGADLTRLTMLADLASGETGAGGSEHLKKLSSSSRAAARDLKEMIWVANPANDTVEGLVSRVCQSAEDLLRDARIKCRLEVAPHLPEQPLSLEQRRNLLLVAREALNNVLKHAGATEVCLRASSSDGQLELVIADNGHGFDPRSARADGLGLNSMRKRMENAGGTFELESHPGTGTRITITLRLQQNQ